MYKYSVVILFWDILVLLLEGISTQTAILINDTCTRYKFAPFDTTSWEDGKTKFSISAMEIFLFKLYNVNNYPFIKIWTVIVTVLCTGEILM